MFDINNLDNTEETNTSDMTEEFDSLVNLAATKISNIEIIQDKLRNHIALLESVVQSLEQRLQIEKNQDKRLAINKTISFTYERLLKLYEIYNNYENTTNKYLNSSSDTIHKKHKLVIEYNRSPGNKDFDTAEFLQNIHKTMTGLDNNQLNEISQDIDEDLKL